MPDLYGICAAGKRIKRSREDRIQRAATAFVPRATAGDLVISVQSYICVVLNHRGARAHAPVRTQDQASHDRRHQIRIEMAQHEQKRTDAEVTTEALRAKAREEFFLK